ncbi:GGDEF domain-containing protein [Candidatus Epulonipiscium viviparus]|uniref:GGDEF domain-containing protein n=1 Tax=Candidatus Epulonipiscium viviparus TaxID=420336 RepID=UPI00016C0EDA|nr:GGDEF domain-containing protein [Candidatus Epulopiscium viviparus]
MQSSDNAKQLEELENELNMQRGMVWLLGEVMKTAYETTTFVELMESTTDMIMGVTGASSCYLWVDKKNYLRIFERNIDNNNHFRSYDILKSNSVINNPKEIHLYNSEEITQNISELGCSTKMLPKSRLYVPLLDFTTSKLLGGIILEQFTADYFTANKQTFFQTLGVFIAINIKKANILALATRESELDPMTKLYNRRSLDKLFNLAKENNDDIIVAIVDIDYFKSINDIKGHDTGDAVIKFVAKLLCGYLDPLRGTVVRYGGDEFVIIIPVHYLDAAAVLNNILETYINSDFIKSLKLLTSLTIGMSVSASNLNIQNLISIADEALLEGKRLGKNVVILNNHGSFSKV